MIGLLLLIKILLKCLFSSRFGGQDTTDMEAAEVITIGKDALIVLLKVSLPIMLVALVVGLLISLFQALTQIQEMTLSFVPKIIAIFFSLILFLPYIFDTLKTFAETLNVKITNLS